MKTHIRIYTHTHTHTLFSTGSTLFHNQLQMFQTNSVLCLIRGHVQTNVVMGNAGMNWRNQGAADCVEPLTGTESADLLIQVNLISRTVHSLSEGGLR